MHTARQLDREGFQVEIEGKSREIEDLVPEWQDGDRFGIVVTEPLAGVGASLLIQLATVSFFDAKPARRLRETAEYPEIYLFHFRGVHGDYSGYDFWPPRKEVMVQGNQPINLLESLNSHCISRLALPDGPLGDREGLHSGVSTWAEEHSAEARIRSSFAYGPHGSVPQADVVLRSSHPRVEENVNLTLDTVQGARDYLALPEDEFLASLPGPSVPRDVHRWTDTVWVRADEVDPVRRDEARTARARMLEAHDGVSTESYRQLTVDEALRRIAHL